MLMLAFSVMLAGFPPAQAKAPCPMMAKMGKTMEQGKPCHCPCCDKDGDGKSSCGDNGCTTSMSVPAGIFFAETIITPLSLPPVKERFYRSDPVLISSLLLTQDRPPKLFS